VRESELLLTHYLVRDHLRRFFEPTPKLRDARVGDWVVVEWATSDNNKHNLWFRGQVVHCDDEGTLHIMYDDGELMAESTLSDKEVRLIPRPQMPWDSDPLLSRMSPRVTVAAVATAADPSAAVVVVKAEEIVAVPELEAFSGVNAEQVAPWEAVPEAVPAAAAAAAAPEAASAPEIPAAGAAPEPEVWLEEHQLDLETALAEARQ
jgi:hypothetical protein